jgi:hypothetical protein
LDGTPPQRGELQAGFDAVAACARTNRRPIFVREFGTTNNADMASRARRMQFYRELAERYGVLVRAKDQMG